MVEVAACAVPGKISTLLVKMREVGVPDKATVEWLKTLGFKSSNDRSLLAVLNQADFISADGRPTKRWRDYRGGDYKTVMAQAIRDGYPKLYQTYPDPHDRPAVDLSHIFATQSSAGKQTIDRMVSTFKALCALADFGGQAAPTPAPNVPEKHSVPPSVAVPSGPPVLHAPGRSGPGLTVNVNIQLTLPETTDSKVFDAFFKSMKAHLLTEEDD